MLRDKWKPHEINYSTRDLELTTIIFAGKIGRHYLYEEKCKISTNHESLQYLFTQMNLILGNEDGLGCLVIMIARPG